MIRKIIISSIIILMILVSFSGCFEDNKTKEQASIKEYDFYVNGDGTVDYMNIQDAVDAAFNGYSIFVYKGVYYENIQINKSITLIGEDRENTIIQGDKKTDTISIMADHVNITGFTIQNNQNSYKPSGVYISSNFNCIYENKIYYCGGLEIFHSRNNTISKNIISSCYCGIYISKSMNNTISYNNILLNKGHGVCLSNSSYNQVSSNYIINNIEGIYFSLNSNNNTVTSNKIINNEFGIRIISIKNEYDDGQFKLYLNVGEKYRNSNENIFYLNTMVENNEHNAYDECNNTWYDEKLELGNYWDDYDGNITYEGVGGVAYNISGGDNQDKFPIISEGDFVTGEILVAFNKNVNRENITKLIESYHLLLENIYNWSSRISTLIKVPAGEEAYWIKIFKNEGDVLYAELNGIVYLDDPVNLEEVPIDFD